MKPLSLYSDDEGDSALKDVPNLDPGALRGDKSRTTAEQEDVSSGGEADEEEGVEEEEEKCSGRGGRRRESF